MLFFDFSLCDDDIDEEPPYHAVGKQALTTNMRNDENRNGPKTQHPLLTLEVRSHRWLHPLRFKRWKRVDSVPIRALQCLWLE